jgi:hypothetical protein
MVTAAQRELRTDIVGFKRDHTAAFRPLPLLPSEQYFATFAVKESDSPQAQFGMFTHRSLPFGGRSIPNQYNRLPRSLCVAFTRLFGVLVDHYFDDFIGFDAESNAASAEAVLDEVHAMLGFRLQTKPSKVVHASRTMDVLGLRVDIRRHSEGGGMMLTLDEAKAAKSAVAIQSALQTGTISGATCSKLVGRLSFLAAAVIGNAARSYLWPLYDRVNCKTGEGYRPLSPALRSALEMLLLVVQHRIPPRQIPRDQSTRNLWWCYTDGMGGDLPAMGGVLLSPLNTAMTGARDNRSWYVALYEEQHRDLWSWLPGDRESIIAGIEAIAVLYAAKRFAHICAGSTVVFWIDNEPAQAAFTKGYSPDTFLNAIVRATLLELVVHGITPVFCFLYSENNPADAISRGDRRVAAWLCCEEGPPPPGARPIGRRPVTWKIHDHRCSALEMWLPLNPSYFS